MDISHWEIVSKTDCLSQSGIELKVISHILTDTVVGSCTLLGSNQWEGVIIHWDKVKTEGPTLPLEIVHQNPSHFLGK